MNPIITTLGPAETSHSRLTFAQAFNSIGVFLMVYGGATVLLGDSKPVITSYSIHYTKLYEIAIKAQSLKTKRVIPDSAVLFNAFM